MGLGQLNTLVSLGGVRRGDDSIVDRFGGVGTLGPESSFDFFGFGDEFFDALFLSMEDRREDESHDLTNWGDSHNAGWVGVLFFGKQKKRVRLCQGGSGAGLGSEIVEIRGLLTIRDPHCWIPPEKKFKKPKINGPFSTKIAGFLLPEGGTLIQNPSPRECRRHFFGYF